MCFDLISPYIFSPGLDRKSEGTIWLLFVISPVEMWEDSLQGLVSEVAESLPDARKPEEDGGDLSNVKVCSLAKTEAGPQVGEIVTNQPVVGVGHNMVVREEHGHLVQNIWYYGWLYI